MGLLKQGLRNGKGYHKVIGLYDINQKRMAIRPSFFLICAAVRLLQGYRRCNHIRGAVGVAYGGGKGVAAGAQLHKDSALGAAVEGPAD